MHLYVTEYQVIVSHYSALNCILVKHSSVKYSLVKLKVIVFLFKLSLKQPQIKETSSQ